MRESVTAATGERARAARASGRRLKVVAQARRLAPSERSESRGSAVEAAVRLEELPADDPLAILDGQANALEIDSWPLGRIVITQRDGGMEKTAYALLSDLVSLVRR
jgi:homoserine dehydrogenase